MKNPDRCILLTIDVEDWFQVENLKGFIPFSSWPFCESRVERNTHLLLDLLDSASGGKGKEPGDSGNRPGATFFILGWIARRLPGLVREIASRGHEIASHGFTHDLCHLCSRDHLRLDLSRSKEILEDIIGDEVIGYRAPSFSIGVEVLEVLRECGYKYDSSFNPFAGNPRHGRLKLAPNGGGIVSHALPSLYELPISNLKIGKFIMPTGGGGYFRLLPSAFFKRAARAILKNEGAYLFYMHPWEMDPEQPRIKDLPFSLRFRHYVNLDKTAAKLADLMAEFADCRFLTCRGYLQEVHGRSDGEPKNGCFDNVALLPA